MALQQKISNIAIEEVRHKTYIDIPKREREITYEIQKIYIFNILFQKFCITTTKIQNNITQYDCK